MTPLLTILTRHWPQGRAESYKRFMATIDAQTVGGFEHWIERDDYGRGVKWADANLADAIPQTAGRYIWLVDDDDLLDPDAVAIITQAIQARDCPGVVVVKGTFAQLGILPRDNVWHKSPVLGSISGQNVIVRRDLALKHCCAWRDDPMGDYGYCMRLWADEPRIEWLNQVIVHQQRQGRGRADWEQDI